MAMTTTEIRTPARQVPRPRTVQPRPAQPKPAQPRIALPRRARRVLVIVHVAASVALLGQLWVNTVLAVVAMRSTDPVMADAAYRFLTVLVPASAIPLSVISMLTGIVLGLGTKWGVLRHRWVSLKVVLLIATVALGISVQGPLVLGLIEAPTRAAQWAHLAVGVGQASMIIAATALSVVKPGGRWRRARTAAGAPQPADATRVE